MFDRLIGYLFGAYLVFVYLCMIVGVALAVGLFIQWAVTCICS